MAEVTSDLIHGALKPVRRHVADVCAALAPTGGEPMATGGHLDAIQQDVHTLYLAGARRDERLVCIERRLDLAAAH